MFKKPPHEIDEKRVNNKRSNTFRQNNFTGHQLDTESSASSSERDFNVQLNSNASTHFNDHSRESECDADELTVLGKDFKLFDESQEKTLLDIAAKKIYKITVNGRWGTGFFFELCSSNEKLFGIFTNCHVISCKEDEVVIHLPAKEIRIETNDIKYFFSDSLIDVTFIAFSDETVQKLRCNGGDFLLEYSNNNTTDLSVTGIQHPGGGEKRKCDGNVIERKFYDNDYDIRYSLSTLPGSSGSPIFISDNAKVLAIHKAGGKWLDITTILNNQETKVFGEDNVGTLMKYAIEMVQEKHSYEIKRQKENVVAHHLSIMNDKNDYLLDQSKTAIFALSFSKFGTKEGDCFLCRVKFPKGIIAHCLITTTHVINLQRQPKYFVKIKNQEITHKNVLWSWSRKKFHLTFMVLSQKMVKELTHARQYFLPVAENELVLPMEVFLYNESHVGKGRIVTSYGNELVLDGNHLPGVKAPLILNNQYEVVGIQKPCCNDYIVALKVTADSLAKIEVQDNFESYLRGQENVNEGTDEEKTLLFAVCNVLSEKQVLIHSKRLVTGSGFLCLIKCPLSGRSLYGLVTATVLVNERCNFKIKFGNKTTEVNFQDILWELLDETLQISYLVFKNSFLKNLETNNFLDASDDYVLGKPSIRVLEHNTKRRQKTSLVAAYFIRSYITDGSIIEYDDIRLIYSAYPSSVSTGSPIIDQNSKLIGVHISSISGYHFAVQMKNFVKKIMEKSSERDEAFLRDSRQALCSARFDDGIPVTGFLCSVSYPWRRKLKGLLLAGYWNNSSPISIYKEGVDSLLITVQPDEIPLFFADEILKVTFILFTDTLVKQMEDKKMKFLSTFWKDPLNDSTAFIFPENPQFNYMKTAKVKVQKNHTFRYITEEICTRIGFPIFNNEEEVIGIHQEAGPLDIPDHPTYYVATKIKYIVDAVSAKFQQLIEWEIVVDPLNGESQENAIKKYLQDHPYVEHTGKSSFKDNILLINIRSRGLTTIEFDPLDNNDHAQKHWSDYIARHPGLVWSGKWKYTQSLRKSAIEVDCLGKPDNDWPKNSPKSVLKIYNKSYHVVKVKVDDNKEYESDPDVSPSLNCPMHTLPAEKRYVKINLKLCDDKKNTLQQTWFYTRINYSWIINDKEICRGKEDDPEVEDEYSEYEKESNSLEDVSDYKWTFCNQIKRYYWRPAT